MTPTQIDAILSGAGGPTGHTGATGAMIRFVRTISSGSYAVTAAPGVPGSYSVSFNDSLMLATFTPVLPTGATGAVDSAVVTYDDIEAIDLWPLGTPS